MSAAAGPPSFSVGAGAGAPAAWDADATNDGLEELESVFWSLAECRPGVKVSVGKDGRFAPTVSPATQERAARYLGYVGTFAQRSAWGRSAIAARAAIEDIASETLGGGLASAASEAVTGAGSRLSLESAMRSFSGDSLVTTASGIESISERTVALLKRCQALAQQVLPEQSTRVDDLIDLQLHVNTLLRDYVATVKGLENLQETYGGLFDKKVTLGMAVGIFRQNVHPELEETSRILNETLNRLRPQAAKPPSPPPAAASEAAAPPAAGARASPPSLSPSPLLPSPSPPSPSPSPVLSSVDSRSSLSSLSETPSETPSRASPELGAEAAEPAAAAEAEGYDQIGVRDAGTQKKYINDLFERYINVSLGSMAAITPSSGKVMFQYYQDKGSQFVPSLGAGVSASIGIFGSAVVRRVESLSRRWYAQSVDSTALGISTIKHEIINHVNYLINGIRMGKFNADQIAIIRERVGALEDLLQAAVAGLVNLQGIYSSEPAKEGKIQKQSENFVNLTKTAIIRLKAALAEAAAAQAGPAGAPEKEERKEEKTEKKEEKRAV